jgi:sporulation protein YlmC with PRC-barrel domain
MYFSIFSGVVVTISEFDRITELTESCFPVYDFRGKYIGYIEDEKIHLNK